MKSSTLVMIRHGQSQWNLENKFTGWVDVDLTDTGKEEARKAAEQVKGDQFDVAYTSALVRAQHTLDIIQKARGWEGLPVIKDKALNERFYGDLQGLNKTDTAKKYGKEQVHLWRRSYDVQPPGGESLKDTCHRVIPYFKKEILPRLAKGEDVLIVAHGNSLRALVKFIENLPPDEIINREIATGEPIRYVLDQQKIQQLEKEELD